MAIAWMAIFVYARELQGDIMNYTLTKESDECRIGLIDSNAIIRSGLRSIIADEQDFRLCAESSNREEALPEMHHLALHVIVLGLNEATEPGLEDIRELREKCSEAAVVVFTKIRSESFLVKTLLAGATTYLVNDSEPREVVLGIRTAFGGQNLHVPQILMLRALEAIQSGSESGSSDGTGHLLGLARLTERESEVLREMATGAAYKVIAENLFLAESTVKKYAHNVITKLGADNRLSAVVKAHQLNMVRPPENRTDFAPSNAS